MEEPVRILLVEDSHDDVALIEYHLKKEGLDYVLRIIETQQEYGRELENFLPDVVISDYSLAQFDSMEALKVLLNFKERTNHIAGFVLVIGTVSEEFAVKAIQNGADDYVRKDRLKRLPAAVLGAVEKQRLREQRRKEEEEKLYLLNVLQKSLHEILIIDPDNLQFKYVNEEARRNLGYSYEEILSLTPADTILDFNEERFREIISSVEHSPKGRIYERFAVRKDGTLYPLQIHLESVEHGQKKLLLANCLDITETKEHAVQKELALFIQDSFSGSRSLEESLTLILQHICSRYSIPTAELWAKDYNDELRRYAIWKTGDNPEPMKSSLFAEKVFSSERYQQFENLNTASENDEQAKEEHYLGAGAFPIKLGTEVTAVVVVHTNKIIEGRDVFINFKEGVQDKLANNIKRKKTEEELQKIFEFSPDILAIVRRERGVVRVNPALQKTLGYSEEEIKFRSFEEFIHPEDLESLREWRQAELLEDEVGHYESRWLAANGEYRYFSWSVTPFMEEGLQFAVGKDVTDYKEQVKAIQVQNEKLAEIAWEQSHTVRAPLAKLMACIAYMERYEDNREEVLEGLKKSAHELDAVVRGIIQRTEKITQYEEC